MIENTLSDIQWRIQKMQEQIDALYKHIISEKKDYKRQSESAQELVVKGKMPRKQPKKKHNPNEGMRGANAG